jgi:DNA (cytosine-5)-methyltransferase 3A
MKVLSLFDGISCAYEGLIRAKINVKEYYACEIDKYAIKVSQSRHPDIIRPVDDVRFLSKLMLPKIDLLIGGSPCTDLSIAKKNREGLKGSKSSLFWEYVRVLREVKPKSFIFENVASMPKADKDIITQELGVEPVMFNASLVSAQNRKRLFWTNIKFELPKDSGIVLKDILQPDAEVDERMVTKDAKAFCLDACYYKGSSVEHSIERKNRTMVKVGHIGNSDAQANRVYSPYGKTPTLSANGGGLGAKTGLYNIEGKIRKLTPIECERLQGLLDDYTAGISNTQRYKCLGNAFNVDVIACIVSTLPSSCEERT